MSAKHIEQVRPIFTDKNLISLKSISQNFYAELDEEYGSFKDHILIQQFSFSEAWPTWEMHPEGDEMVFLIAGDTDLVLSEKDGSETVIRVTTPGEYVVVPKGTWHTARPHAATTMLFITPGEGTLNALEPGGDPL